RANMLQPLRSAIYAFKTDFVVATWIARLKPTELAAAQHELANESFANPRIRDFEDEPLDLKAVDKPVNVLMDIEPRNAETITLPGGVPAGHWIVGPTLARALIDAKPVASDPVPLLRKQGPIGIVLVAPVLQEGAEPAGFVSFSYELGPLMLANDDRSLF